MYDPLVVDKFVTFKDELSEALTGSLEHLNNVEGLLKLRVESPQDLQKASAPSASQYDDDRLEPKHAVRVVLAAVNKEISSVLSVVYLKERSKDALFVFDALGMQAGGVAGVSVPLGSRVTGWVAANGTPIINTDARLELPASVGLERDTLCTVLPLRSTTEVVGVLLVTRHSSRPFDEAEIALLERVCLKFNETPLRELITDSLRNGKVEQQKRPSIH